MIRNKLFPKSHFIKDVIDDHKNEIRKLFQKSSEKGFTVVPLKLYFKDALIKVEVGLCKGKHTYDKKQSLMEKDIKRAMDREIKGAR